MPGLFSRLFGRRNYPVATPVYPVAQVAQGPSDLRARASSVVEKIRVATIGGRLRLLPWYDPYTEETPEIRAQYPVMLRESTVKAAFLTKTLAVCSLPVQLHPQEPDDPRHREAAEFTKWSLKQVGRPRRNRPQGNVTSTSTGTAGIAWSVLSGGLMMGHSLCEKVWDPLPVQEGRWRGKRCLAAIKPKDTRFVHLGVDEFRNVEAVRGTGFNAGRVWDPADFVVWSFLSLFENPAGMSDFRSAYRAYWIKDTAWKLRSLYLDKYASGPFLKGTYTDAQTQKAALEEALENARANTWLTIPQGALVEVMDLATRGTADFASAIADCDKEILIALVGAHLQILEGQVKGARGDTEVHQETAELYQWWLAESMAGVYQNQILPDLYAENYHGVEPADVSLGTVSEQAMEARARVDRGLQEIGMKLSKKEAYRYYGRQEPEDDGDTLQPKGGGGPGGPDQPPGGGGAGPAPFSEWSSFCDQGPNQGKPGPCPEEVEGHQARAQEHRATAQAHQKEGRAAHREASRALERSTWTDVFDRDHLNTISEGLSSSDPVKLKAAVEAADKLLKNKTTVLPSSGKSVADLDPATARALPRLKEAREKAQAALLARQAHQEARGQAKATQKERARAHTAEVQKHEAALGDAADDMEMALTVDRVKDADLEEAVHQHDMYQLFKGQGRLDGQKEAAEDLRKSAAAVAAKFAGQEGKEDLVAAARKTALNAGRAARAIDALVEAKGG